jgi:type I restriction enzyme, S subunit
MRNHWPIVQLGQVLRHRKEFNTIDDLTNYKRPRVQLHVQGIVLRDEIPGALIKTKTQQVCRAGEFLVAEIDAKVGGFGIVPPALDGAIVSSHYFLFVIDETKLDRRFLDFFIRTPAFREQITAQGSTNYAAIRPLHVLGYEIPLPPLAEQRRVVARIEELAAQIHDARTLRHQAAEEVVVLVPSGMADTFKRLGQEHTTKKLEKLCDVVRGGSPRPAGSPLYYGGDIPFMKVGDLTKDDGMYLFETSATVNELGREQSRYIEADTLMLTNSGATLGVPKITRIAGCFNDGSQAFLNLDSSVEKEYLYYLFKSKTLWFREQLARGQGQPNLNTDMTKQMDVPVPPLPEQRRIVAELDALQAEVDALKRLQADTAAELDALLPSILDKAFKGEL